MYLRKHQPLRHWILGAMALVGAGFLYFSYVLLVAPVLDAAPTAPAKDVQLPPYDVREWHGFLVQHQGRSKPFESAATETVRQITGREKYQGKDPVAIALMWKLLNGDRGGTRFMDWENYPFILCQYQPLREAVYLDLLFDKLDEKRDGYLTRAGCKALVAERKASKERQDPQVSRFAERLIQGFDGLDRDKNGKLTREELQQGRDLVADQLTEEQRRGKSISPHDLRSSLTLQGAMRRMEEGEAEGGDVSFQNQAGEVAQRLIAYDKISQNPYTQFRSVTDVGGDPIHLVALDKVKGGPLFSVGDLRKCLSDYDPKTEVSESWRLLMVERMRATPQLYVKPEQRKALEQFQEAIKAGTASHQLDELEQKLQARRERVAKTLDALKRRGSANDLLRAATAIARTKEERQELAQRFHQTELEGKEQNADQIVDRIIAGLQEIQAQRDEKVVKDLRHRAAKAAQAKYHPDDPNFRMLHLGYLEALYPSLYEDSAAWQKFPVGDVKKVLAAYDKLQEAYRSGKPAVFDKASRDFFHTVRAVSEGYGSYPTEVKRNLVFIPFTFSIGQMLDYEMTLNHTAPFQKAWIIMLLGVVLFLASMMLPAGRPSQVCYGLAFVAYLTALGFQVFGFALRVIVAGRPPVSNLYETLIWVSFMSGVFALVLEVIYRKKVIGLAGAVVSTLGLVMADQLSLTFDPRISPLLPVLRTNYWLTIHVLTIVSSYAAGTLAWGLGNISLGIIAFGDARKETVKTLARFTYRAIQIAVLLLAFGTFLGGMWAAESWGRFWGWDPKEVWALIALVCYVIPLHMRFIGWVKDFGLAVAAVVCYAAIVTAWYLFSALGGGGLHSYAMSGGGPWWVFWAACLNIEWVLFSSLLYLSKKDAPADRPGPPAEEPLETVGV